MKELALEDLKAVNGGGWMTPEEYRRWRDSQFPSPTPLPVIEPNPSV